VKLTGVGEEIALELEELVLEGLMLGELAPEELVLEGLMLEGLVLGLERLVSVGVLVGL
jgi:hypothetical protein